MQRRLLLATLVSATLAAAWACDEPTPDDRPGAPTAAEPDSPATRTSALGADPSTDGERAAVQEARSGAQQLGGTLKARLLSAMAEGPAHAASFCADSAQSLTGSIAEQTGVRVGRSSARLRNETNAGPTWVRAWLSEQDGRAPDAITPAAGIDGDVARFVAPIRIEGPCLTCHGDPATLDEGVRAVLQTRYPNDRATGYRLGDLRGALWAEAPVTR